MHALLPLPMLPQILTTSGLSHSDDIFPRQAQWDCRHLDGGGLLIPNSFDGLGRDEGKGVGW